MRRPKREESADASAEAIPTDGEATDNPPSNYEIAQVIIESLVKRALLGGEQHTLKELITGFAPRIQSETRRTIGGQFLRKLWLAFSTDNNFRSLLPEQTYTLFLRNVRVRSDVNMSGFVSSPSQVLSGLDMRDSDFAGNVNLSNLHFRRLSLHRCSFSYISLVRSNVSGDIVVTRCGALDDCSAVDARKLTVTGDLILSGSSFIRNKDSEIALNLRNSAIGRTLLLNRAGDYETEIKGTLDLRDATVGASLDCHGLIVTVEKGVAIRADGISVRRDIQMDGAIIQGITLFDWAEIGQAFIAESAAFRHTLSLARATLRGDVSLVGATIDVPEGANAIDLTGARVGRILCYRASLLGGGVAGDGVNVDGPAYFEDSDIRVPRGNAVSLGGAKIVGQLSFKASRIEGEVWLPHCQIRGSCGFERTSIETSGTAIGAIHAEISGSMLLRNGFSAKGLVDIGYASIGRNLAAEGGRFENEGAVALSMTMARISGSVFLRRSGANKGGIPFECHGALACQGTEIGHDLILQHAFFGSPQNKVEDGAEEPLPALDFTGCKVRGTARLHEITAHGLVKLSRAEILGNLEIEYSRFVPFFRTALEAHRISVGHAVNLYNSSFGGSLRFDGCRIGSEIRWSRLVVTTDDRSNTPFMLSFKAADLGQRLRARSLEVVGEKADAAACIIDLTGATVEALEDNLPEGWGRPNAQLRLDGFRYQRILLPRDTEEAVATESRRDWLTQQFIANKPDPKSYRPQVYQALASAQFRAGAQDEARRTIVTGEKHRRQAGLMNAFERLLSYLFETLFGLGLSRFRALVTITVTIALSAFLVSTANESGFLIRRNPNPERPVYACGNDFSPLLYSIQMSIPFGGLPATTDCVVGLSPARDGSSTIHLRVPGAIGGPWALNGISLWFALLTAIRIWSWIVISLTIFTFSGLMRRFTYNP